MQHPKADGDFPERGKLEDRAAHRYDDQFGAAGAIRRKGLRNQRLPDMCTHSEYDGHDYRPSKQCDDPVPRCNAKV